ncbi:hypothetical protein [Piscinibacter koreensis]|uniref:Uncharacterized protein n=1 Tax=Piscinibacter koreensis TaxID=2742824 RepID=A0A7Y6TXX6_9BURK|nr:hypothetical protein [Schlegelella koreensis]NUZ07609.1 hypothetical protein [Schlegelella koreensis]
MSSNQFQAAMDELFTSVKGFVERSIAVHAGKSAEMLEQVLERLDNQPPGLSYEGLWVAGKSYSKGMFVTHQGSVWASMVPNNQDQPGAGGGSWVLAVKRGRDGRDAAGTAA